MRQVDWKLTERQLAAFAVDEPHWLPALANASALLWQELDDVNWVGFYLSGALLEAGLPADELFLGPFQGKVACVRIPWGRGVCGTSAMRNQTLRVDDVHEFAEHIACDADSRSEIVVPLHAGGRVVGVLDIDSPTKGRFSEADAVGFEAIARTIEEVVRF